MDRFSSGEREKLKNLGYTQLKVNIYTKWLYLDNVICNTYNYVVNNNVYDLEYELVEGFVAKRIDVIKELKEEARVLVKNKLIVNRLIWEEKDVIINLKRN